MKFSLSTLLIIVTILAILAAQFQFGIKRSRADRIGLRVPTGRLVVVAAIEGSLFAGWLLARLRRFPWKSVVATACILHALFTLRFACIQLRWPHAESLLSAAIVLAWILSVAVAAVFASYAFFACINAGQRVAQARAARQYPERVLGTARPSSWIAVGEPVRSTVSPR